MTIFSSQCTATCKSKCSVCVKPRRLATPRQSYRERIKYSSGPHSGERKDIKSIFVLQHRLEQTELFLVASGSHSATTLPRLQDTLTWMFLRAKKMDAHVCTRLVGLTSPFTGKLLFEKRIGIGTDFRQTRLKLIFGWKRTLLSFWRNYACVEGLKVHFRSARHSLLFSRI
jgi:hypothetical protein